MSHENKIYLGDMGFCFVKNIQKLFINRFCNGKTAKLMKIFKSKKESNYFPSLFTVHVNERHLKRTENGLTKDSYQKLKTMTKSVP